MKPKILHLLDDHSTGGITKNIRYLSNSFLREQFDFRLINSQKLLLSLPIERPDLVIIGNPSSWRRSLDLSRIKLYGCRTIIHEHHYSENYTRCNVKYSARFHAMLKLSYALADQVVSVSQGQIQWMQKYRLVHPQKLRMITQSPHLDPFLSVPNRLRLNQSPLILSAYGRLSRQKGFDTLIRAMALVTDLNIHLNIGGDGSEAESLHQLAQGQPNIKFWGAIDEDIPTFLAASDIVIIPSRWEPWGSVCIEARAAGKPVIISDVDGLSEQVQNCGLRVPPDDPQALAAAIRTVASASSEQLSTWGNHARNSVHLAWENYLESWRSLLWEILQS